MKGRVMVALSGGVDSAVAAFLLKDQGYETAGLTMSIMAEHGGISRCGAREVEDARLVCRALGIEHHVVELARELDRFVIEPFISEYRIGRTPNPCVECNRHIKFGLLLELSHSMGFDFLATGHYAAVDRTDNTFRMQMPRDTRKDQTYFLSGIRKEALSRIVFPLAGLLKDEVREIARSQSLPVTSKPESQDVCFIPRAGTRSFLEERIDETPGDIVDRGGAVIGRHRGVAFYTVGQRAGLNLSRGRPVYVLAKDIGKNRIIAGEREYLLARGLTADRVNLLADELPPRARAKIRYAHTPAACSLTFSDGQMTVLFDEPQEAVTPGQTVALYDEGILLASGVIREAIHEHELI